MSVVSNSADDTASQALYGTETRFERLQRQRQISFRRWMRAFIYDVIALLREARIPLVGLLIVMVSGTIYFMVTDRYDLFAAMHQTMSMLLFEQDASFPDNPLGRLLFFAIPLLGIAFVFQGVLDFGRLLLDKSSRLEAWQIAQARTYDDHIIVCGLGRVAYSVMIQLIETGYEVVVIESDWQSEFLSQALALNVPVIHGDAREPRILRLAGIDQAHSVIAVVNSDLTNIEIGLNARRIRRNMHVVLRIFSEQLDHDLEQGTFGTNTAFSSSALSAPTLAVAAVCRSINYALPLPEAVMGIAELTVAPGSKLDSLVYQIEQTFNVQILSYTSSKPHEHEQWRHTISPTTRLYPNDRIKVLGTIDALNDIWQYGYASNRIAQILGFEVEYKPTPQHNTIIVCGLGKVGYRVVQALYHLRDNLQINIVAVYYENTRERFLNDLRQMDIKLVRGDARINTVLYEAGIEEAFSIVAVTSKHLDNLRIGLLARQIRSDIHLVMRVFSDMLADQLDYMFGSYTGFSTSMLAAPTLAAASVLKGTTSYAIGVGTRLLSTARLSVWPNGQYAGYTIQELREWRGIVVVSVRRAGQLFLMPGDPEQPGKLFEDRLRGGDEIVVLTDVTKIANLQEYGAELAISDRAFPDEEHLLPSQTERQPRAQPQPQSSNARATRKLEPLSEIGNVPADIGSDPRVTRPLAVEVEHPAPTTAEPTQDDQHVLEQLLRHKTSSAGNGHIQDDQPQSEQSQQQEQPE